MNTNTTSNVRTMTTSKGKTVVSVLTDAEACMLLQRHTSTFAADLLAKGRKYGLSADQKVWTHILAMEIHNADLKAAGQAAVGPVAPVVVLGNMDVIAKMFMMARERGLKFPKVRLTTTSGKKIVLSMAGDRSKNPGAINVTDGRKFGENVWFGRIDTDGTWVGSRSATAEVVDLLKAFAASPERVAKEYGQLSGSCCFCGRDLTTKVSVHCGYGEICGIKFGLSYKLPDGEFSEIENEKFEETVA